MAAVNGTNGIVSRRMTRADLEHLRGVVRLRARSARDEAAARSADLLADAECQLAATYKFDDAAWADVMAKAHEAEAEANKVIAAECRRRGVRPEFQPKLSLG